MRKIVLIAGTKAELLNHLAFIKGPLDGTYAPNRGDCLALPGANVSSVLDGISVKSPSVGPVFFLRAKDVSKDTVDFALESAWCMVDAPLASVPVG